MQIWLVFRWLVQVDLHGSSDRSRHCGGTFRQQVLGQDGDGEGTATAFLGVEQAETKAIRVERWDDMYLPMPAGQSIALSRTPHVKDRHLSVARTLSL